MSNTAPSGLRELVLEGVVVTKDGGLCTKTEQVDLNELKAGGPQDNAQKVEAYNDEPLLTRIPDKIIHIGKTSGVCEWGDDFQESPSDKTYPAYLNDISYTAGGSLYSNFKNLEIPDSIKRAGTIPPLADIQRFRRLRDGLGKSLSTGLEAFFREKVPCSILDPLKTKKTYKRFEISPNGSSGCTGWDDNDMRHVFTKPVNNGKIMHHFYGSLDQSFDANDRDAAILCIPETVYSLHCSDTIGFFGKKDDKLYFCQTQGLYDIKHCRLGMHINPTEPKPFPEAVEFVGPIWPGDSITLVSKLTVIDSQITFLFM